MSTLLHKLLLSSLTSRMLIGGFILSFVYLCLIESGFSFITKQQAQEYIKEREKQIPGWTVLIRQELSQFKTIKEKVIEYEEVVEKETKVIKKQNALAEINRLKLPEPSEKDILLHNNKREGFLHLISEKLSNMERLETWLRLGRWYSDTDVGDSALDCYNRVLELGYRTPPKEEIAKSPIMQRAQYFKIEHYLRNADPRLTKDEIDKYFEIGFNDDAHIGGKKFVEHLIERQKALLNEIRQIERLEKMTIEERSTLFENIYKEAVKGKRQFNTYIGIAYAPSFDYPNNYKGVLVNKVREGTPAHQVGLAAGDVIMKIGDHDIKDIDDFNTQLNTLKPDQEVVFKVLSKSVEKTIRMTPKNFYGVFYTRNFEPSTDTKGILVLDVTKDSPADKAGMKAEDAIVKIGDNVIKNLSDFEAVMNALKAGEQVAFTVLREGVEKTFFIIPIPRTESLGDESEVIDKETFIENLLPSKEAYEIGPGTHFIPYHP